MKKQPHGRILLAISFCAFTLALAHLSAQQAPPPAPLTTAEAARKSAEDAAADREISALITEIGQQQVALTQNYEDLDKRLVEFEEIIRQTRIFAARVGKK